MLNTFPRWKYALLALSLMLGLVYALPNLYGEEVVVLLQRKADALQAADLQARIKENLHQAQLPYKNKMIK